ncbi:MAG TPA: hypothetical protein VHI72_04075 [Hyphomicrobiaceae bacterium]|jgi:hypothetical protein|nr:hypothetical protein [Hyphomicrobiaceae bacterium]
MYKQLVTAAIAILLVEAPGQATPTAGSKVTIFSPGSDAIGVTQKVCRGKGVGTRACYQCCRAHALSASRCLRNCRLD